MSYCRFIILLNRNLRQRKNTPKIVPMSDNMVHSLEGVWQEGSLAGTS